MNSSNGYGRCMYCYRYMTTSAGICECHDPMIGWDGQQRYTYPEFIAKYFPNDVQDNKGQEDTPPNTFFDILKQKRGTS